MDKGRRWGMAVVAAASLAPFAMAWAEVTMEELLQRIEEQEQKILVLERRLEIQDEATAAAKESAATVSTGPRGFSLRSADGKNQLRLRSVLHVDGRHLESVDPGGVTDGWQAKRVRPTLEGTLGGIYDFRLTPGLSTAECRAAIEKHVRAQGYELLEQPSTDAERLRAGYLGWEAAVFTGNPALGRELGINARRTHRMMNGPIECRLLRLAIELSEFVTAREPGRPPVIDAAAARARPGAQMFANRLKKNVDRLAGWARRVKVSCYRLYDADMPEYACAIDLYQSDPEGSAGRWLYVQEYAPPATVERAKARARREEAISVLPEATGLPVDAIFWRTRRPQKGRSRYEALSEEGERVVVEEGGLKFLVNFTDYLDTGLFLDHRLTRARIREETRGRRFVNLFCYTGAATVCAAAGGAVATTSVDMSRTYLDWARRNLAINGFHGDAHRLVQEDCLACLAEDDGKRYDLIFLDPPTFSNSKRMTREFDVQRDHVELIRATLGRLAPGGLLLFSSNFRKFRLDAEALADLSVRDITRRTIPQDFGCHGRVHHCFEIRRQD